MTSRVAGSGLVRRMTLAVLVTCLGLAVAPATVSSSSGPSPLVRAVVLVRDGATLPLAVPGGRVLDVFRGVGSEVVQAPYNAVAQLARDGRVLGVAPDARVRVESHDNGGTARDSVLAADALGGEAGLPGTGYHVNVALLDTGVSDTAALNRASGRITDGVDVSPLAHGGQPLTSGEFTDGFGHGTFLASLIAGGPVTGSGDRAIGVAPAARIVVVKVADDQGNTSLSSVMAGLDWVAAHARGIQVVNLALAVERYTSPAYGADPLTAAIEHVRSKGVVVVAAAGNEAGQVGDPGMDPEALTVGAADGSGGDPTVAPFSGSGVVAGVQKPDVVAPGVHVLGVMPADSVIAAAHPEGWQGSLFRGSGTSEATAITSGVAAAYLSDHPGASPLQVKAVLRHDARDLHDPAAGEGLLRMPHGATVPGTVGLAGEANWHHHAWNANAWDAVPDWQSQLDSFWSGDAWDATTWSATTWSATTWSATTWSATTWSATTWSATTWSATTWSATTWSATTWSATTWSATTWSDYGWGDA